MSPLNIQGKSQLNLIDTLTVCNLSQYNHLRNNNGRILDWVLSNSEVRVDHCCDPLVPEDPHHKAILLSTNFMQPHKLPAKPIVSYNYRQANYTAIAEELDGYDWHKELHGGSLDDAVLFFYDILNKVRNIHVPHRLTVTPVRYPPWYKKPLIKILREKAKSHRKFKKYGNLSDQLSFTTLRQRAKDLERDMFNSYIAGVESGITKNPRAFWRYVKSKKQSHSYPSIFKYKEQSFGTGEDICNIFSDYFYSNFVPPDLQDAHTKLDMQDFETSVNIYDDRSDIASIEIQSSEVFKLLKRVDLNKSAGPDNFPPIFILNCAKSLTLPISILFRRSLTEGTMPAIWKSAYVTPIHKKGPRDEVENYRPISKLCVFAKILEKIIYKQSSKILLYADDMKILHKICSLDDTVNLQDDLDRFQAYCTRNKLDLNVSKCYVCTFTPAAEGFTCFHCRSEGK
ncbi:uncharacterized protein LOC111365081 [Spodoptera litura]|uniref:Uncharacterized protein LOC111365081 n=1 Tax=Spodoptera litura TaxID=69820 RepID=A0A9J7ET00_SPOLT|nr:uncharacterized protein LOC111365081 [Spodoptera litura]